YPVFEPKVAEKAVKSTVDELAKIAETMTPERIEAVHRCLQILAGLDADHASVINNVGFNKVDGRIGHSLANSPRLTPRQAALGLKIVRKYHRQLPEELLEIAKGDKK
ncbi:hypothetical protein D6833_04195, partial [Candidatus Parcubacteria bacterium]